MKASSKLASAVESSMPCIGSGSWAPPPPSAAPPPPPAPSRRACIRGRRGPRAAVAAAEWLSKPQVAIRLGRDVRTINRWLDDEHAELGFPRPRDFNGQDMFKRVEIEAWENSRPSK